MILITILIIIFILCPLLFLCTYKKIINTNTKNTLPSMYHCNKYDGGKIMKNLNFNNTTNPKKADIYLPCGYTFVEKELNNYNSTNGQTILAIDGCDKIVSKSSLLHVIRNEYGKDFIKLTPKGYATMDKDDMKLLQKEFNPNKIYIMKKNLQRQLGLKITKDFKELLEGYKQGYVVIQEYLMSPLLIDNRKFDIRIYLLVIQKNNVQYYYRHTGGRCHYTSKDFTTTDISDDIHIPSGYTEDKDFKNTHPETLIDLQEYLNKDGTRLGDLLFYKMDDVLRKCCVSFSKVLGQKCKKDRVYCQLFGLDFLCDSHYNPILIEVNKGPEMNWNTKIEKEYKIRLVKDMFKLLEKHDDNVDNGYNLLIILFL